MPNLPPAADKQQCDKLSNYKRRNRKHICCGKVLYCINCKNERALVTPPATYTHRTTLVHYCVVMLYTRTDAILHDSAEGAPQTVFNGKQSVLEFTKTHTLNCLLPAHTHIHTEHTDTHATCSTHYAAVVQTRAAVLLSQLRADQRALHSCNSGASPILLTPTTTVTSAAATSYEPCPKPCCYCYYYSAYTAPFLCQTHCSSTTRKKSERVVLLPLLLLLLLILSSHCNITTTAAATAAACTTTACYCYCYSSSTTGSATATTTTAAAAAAAAIAAPVLICCRLAPPEVGNSVFVDAQHTCIVSVASASRLAVVPDAG
jgi:hypothetical protein